MVDGKAGRLAETHDPQRSGNGPPARRQQGTADQHEHVTPDAAVKWHRKGCIQPSSTAGPTLGIMAHRLRPRPPKAPNAAGGAEGGPMASSPDDMRVRIEAYPWPSRRGGVEVVRANKGYTLYSLRTGGPVARLRPTGQGDKVQVLWWRREAWGNPGPFGREVMPLDEALEFIATEGFFWIHAS